MNNSSILKVLIIGEDKRLDTSLKNYGYSVFVIVTSINLKIILFYIKILK